MADRPVPARLPPRPHRGPRRPTTSGPYREAGLDPLEELVLLRRPLDSEHAPARPARRVRRARRREWVAPARARRRGVPQRSGTSTTTRSSTPAGPRLVTACGWPTMAAGPHRLRRPRARRTAPATSSGSPCARMPRGMVGARPWCSMGCAGWRASGCVEAVVNTHADNAPRARPVRPARLRPPPGRPRRARIVPTGRRRDVSDSAAPSDARLAGRGRPRRRRSGAGSGRRPVHARDADLQLVSQKLVLAPEEPLDRHPGRGRDGPRGHRAGRHRLGPAAPPARGAARDPRRGRRAREHGRLPVGPAGRCPHGTRSAASASPCPPCRRSADDRRDTLRLSGPGLYPVTFELRTDQDDPVASLLSFVERTDDTVPVVPMSVALVTSVSSPPARQPDGSVAIDERARTDLQQLAAALQHNPAASRHGQPSARAARPARHQRAPRGPGSSCRTSRLCSSAGRCCPGPTSRWTRPPAPAQGLGRDYTRLLAQGEDTLRSLLPRRHARPQPVPGRRPRRGRRCRPPAAAQPGHAERGPRTAGRRRLREDPRTAVDADAHRPGHGRRRVGCPSAGPRLDRAAADGRRRRTRCWLRTTWPRSSSRSRPRSPSSRAAASSSSRRPDWPVDQVFLGTLEDLIGQIPQLHPVDLGGLFAATRAAIGPDGTAPLTIPPPVGRPSPTAGPGVRGGCSADVQVAPGGVDAAGRRSHGQGAARGARPRRWPRTIPRTGATATWAPSTPVSGRSRAASCRWTGASSPSPAGARRSRSRCARPGRNRSRSRSA